MKYTKRETFLAADLCDEQPDCDECPENPRPARKYCDKCIWDEDE
jgi:hypothetical protein